MKIVITHPLYDRTVVKELPSSTTFSQINDMLLSEGFIEPKRGGYNYIMDGELCALNKPVSAYMTDPSADSVQIKVHGLLTILI